MPKSYNIIILRHVASSEYYIPLIFIIKAAATTALVIPMSGARRNYREVLNACNDKKIIYYEWNSKCHEMKDCVNF